MSDIIMKVGHDAKDVVVVNRQGDEITLPVLWEPENWILILAKAASCIGASVSYKGEQILGPTGSLPNPTVWVYVEVWDLAAAGDHVPPRMQIVLHRSDGKKPIYLHQLRVRPKGIFSREVRMQFAQAQAAISELVAFVRKTVTRGVVVVESPEGGFEVYVDSNLVATMDDAHSANQVGIIIRRLSEVP